MPPTNSHSYSSPQHREPSAFEHMAPYLALAVCAVADAVNFQTAFARIYRSETDLTLWLVVLGGTASSLIAGHVAGREFKRRKVGDPDAQAILGYLSIAVLCLIGITTLLVRVMAPVPAQTSTAFGAQQAEAQTWTHQLPAGLFFLAIYAASCLIAIAIGAATHNPLRSKLIVARRAEARATRRAIRRNAEAQRANAYHDELLAQRQAWQEREQRAIEGLRGLACEAKALSRTEAARHLGSPAATSALTHARPALQDVQP